MKILVACEESQAVTIEMRRLPARTRNVRTTVKSWSSGGRI